MTAHAHTTTDRRRLVAQHYGYDVGDVTLRARGTRTTLPVFDVGCAVLCVFPDDPPALIEATLRLYPRWGHEAQGFNPAVSIYMEEA